MLHGQCLQSTDSVNITLIIEKLIKSRHLVFCHKGLGHQPISSENNSYHMFGMMLYCFTDLDFTPSVCLKQHINQSGQHQEAVLQCRQRRIFLPFFYRVALKECNILTLPHIKNIICTSTAIQIVFFDCTGTKGKCSIIHQSCESRGCFHWIWKIRKSVFCLLLMDFTVPQFLYG